MAVTKPTIAVTFGDKKAPKMLSLGEFSKLMKDNAPEESSSEESGSEDDDEGEAETPVEEEEKVHALVGSVSEVKHIYKSAKDRDGNWTWVNKYPEDVEEPAENAITDTVRPGSHTDLVISSFADHH